MKISIRLAEERDVEELRRLIELSVRGLQAGDYSPAQLERALAVVYGVDTRLIADGTYFVAEAREDPEIGASRDSTSAAKAAEERVASTAALKRCATQNPGSSGSKRIAEDQNIAENESVADNRAVSKSQMAAAQDQGISVAGVVGCGGWSRRRTLYGGDQFAGREDSLLDPATEAAKIRAFFVHPGWVRKGIGGMILEACEKAAIAEGFHRLEMGATLTGVPFYRVKGYVELERVEAPLGDGLTLPIVRMGKEVVSG
jgi:Acetyltransferase (GNAT) domain